MLALLKSLLESLISKAASYDNIRTTSISDSEVGLLFIKGRQTAVDSTGLELNKLTHRTLLNIIFLDVI